MTIPLEINSCEDCPHARVERDYAPDPWEDLNKVFCKKLDKFVGRYIEWNERCKIPHDCPFNKNEENK